MIRFKIILLPLLWIAFSIVFTGCGKKDPSEVFTENALKNAAYQTQAAKFSKVTLKDGEYRLSKRSGTASQQTVRFEKALKGTFSGQPMAVVMLTSSAGKTSPPFYELALMKAREGKPANIAGFSLGDRIQVTDFRLDKEQIIVKMTAHTSAASKPVSSKPASPKLAPSKPSPAKSVSIKPAPVKPAPTASAPAKSVSTASAPAKSVSIKPASAEPVSTKQAPAKPASKAQKPVPLQEVEKIFGVKEGGLVLLKTLPPPSVKRPKKKPKRPSPAPPKKDTNAKKQ